MKKELFFTSDEHYGSDRTLELSKRPFKSTEEMDAYMIEKFNEIVPDNAVTYHLGDFGDFSVLQKLNGMHVLIFGNYELKDMIEETNTEKMIRDIYAETDHAIINPENRPDKSLDDIAVLVLKLLESKESECKYTELKERFYSYKRKFEKNGFITTEFIDMKYMHLDINPNCNDSVLKLFMTHRPIDYLKTNDKNYFTLFGHIHGRQMVKKFGLDVGVDAHHFRPVSLKDVLFYKTAIEKHYDENVFI